MALVCVCVVKNQTRAPSKRQKQPTKATFPPSKRKVQTLIWIWSGNLVGQQVDPPQGLGQPRGEACFAPSHLHLALLFSFRKSLDVFSQVPPPRGEDLFPFPGSSRAPCFVCIRPFPPGGKTRSLFPCSFLAPCSQHTRHGVWSWCTLGSGIRVGGHVPRSADGSSLHHLIFHR